MNYCDIQESVYYQKYVDMCLIVKRFYQCHMMPTESIKEEYDLALADYRLYLKANGSTMPIAKYPYHAKNKLTWKFLPLNANEHKGIGTKLNEHWIYYSPERTRNYEKSQKS